MSGSAGEDRARRTFTDLSPRTYEHPTDRAALMALRRVKGFDLVLQRVFGALPERRLQLLYLANAVRVSPQQLPKLDALLGEVMTILDLDERPDLYLVNDPHVNAMAIGMESPFIVLNSALVDAMDEDELRCVLGHEAAHILSGHALYKTMLVLLQSLVRWVLRGPLILPALPVLLALKEWDRKSELSADRASLLVSQDSAVTRRVMLKLAGGSGDEGYSLEEFERQAREYRESGGVVDQLFKVMNLLEQSHPFPVLRVVELGKWCQSEEYAAILAGDYLRRSGGEADAAIGDHRAEAVRSYGADLCEGPEAIGDLVKGVGRFGRSAWSFLFGDPSPDEPEVCTREPRPRPHDPEQEIS